MVIWQRWGIGVAIIGWGCLAISQWIVNSLARDASYYETHGWPKLLAFWIAAALVYRLARLLDSQPGRPMIDKATGQEVVIKNRHTLFFIPVRFWHHIYLGLGAVFLFVKK